jgi:hypothetical protein
MNDIRLVEYNSMHGFFKPTPIYMTQNQVSTSPAGDQTADRSKNKGNDAV